LEWDEPQLRSVLLHELGHLRRGDVAVQWVIQIVCALHWFNPLVWFAAWRLHVERERACDDLVLASGVRASEYAAHLLHVATKLSPVTWTGAGALAMARPSRLEGRLLAVLNHQLDRRRVTGALTMAALGLGLLVLIPTAMLKARAQNEPPPPTGAPPSLKTAETVAPIPTTKRGTADEKRDPPTDEVSRSVTKVTGTVTLEMPDDQSLLLEGKRVSMTSLRNEIELLQRTSPDLNVILRPAVGVKFEKIARILDTLKDARVSSLSFAGDKERAEQTARIRFRQAEQEFERISKLRQQGLVSQVDLDEAQNKVDLLRADGQQATVAEVQLRQAEAKLQRLAKLRSQALVSEEQFEQARAEVELLRATAAERSAEQARADSRNRDVARAEVDVAVADLQITQANLRRIAELVQQKQAAQSQLDVAKAEVVKAEAKLRLAESQFRKFNPPKEEAIEQPRPNRLKTERLAQLLNDEIKVAEGQAKLAREQREAGTATLENYLQAELEVLSLKRQRAGLLGDSAQVKELISQQLQALEDLERRFREQPLSGAANKADELKLRRQILSLQRQQAELE
jgi:biopolymer transport protein ExbD